jgi:hypothetical protein
MNYLSNLGIIKEGSSAISFLILTNDSFSFGPHTKSAFFFIVSYRNMTISSKLIKNFT